MVIQKGSMILLSQYLEKHLCGIRVAALQHLCGIKVAALQETAGLCYATCDLAWGQCSP